VDGSEEGGGVFGIACCDATPAFEVEEGVLDQMPQFVQILVIRSLGCAVFLRWDDGVHPLSLCLFEDCIGVIALVGQKMFRRKPLDQLCSLCAISGGTLCDKDSDRQTMRIHGQMYLGVEPPFVRPMS